MNLWQISDEIDEMDDGYILSFEEFHVGYLLRLNGKGGEEWYWTGTINAKNPLFGLTRNIESAREFTALKTATTMLERIIENAAMMGFINLTGGCILQFCQHTAVYRDVDQRRFGSPAFHTYTVTEMD